MCVCVLDLSLGDLPSQFDQGHMNVYCACLAFHLKETTYIREYPESLIIPEWCDGGHKRINQSGPPASLLPALFMGNV